MSDCLNVDNRTVFEHTDCYYYNGPWLDESGIEGHNDNPSWQRGELGYTTWSSKDGQLMTN